MGRAAAKLQKARKIMIDACELDSPLYYRVLGLLCCAQLMLVDDKRPPGAPYALPNKPFLCFRARKSIPVCRSD